MTQAVRLRVTIHDVLAGHLTRAGEGSAFRLDEGYLGQPRRPVLGQVFEDDPGREHRATQGVPRWFANLLPEGPLRALVARRAGVHESRAIFLLELLGGDLPGAVRVTREPDVSGGEPATPLDGPDDEDGGPAPLKFSLAGVQLKFSVVQGVRGLTIPVSGEGGDWIVKLPDARYPEVPENEHTMLGWAREAGIEVPDRRLVRVDAIEGLPNEVAASAAMALAVRRFDRTDGGPVHIEDFAQVRDLWPRDKYRETNYETVARILLALAGPSAIDELVRRLVAAVAMGNGDAHLTNWSLIYRDRRAASLAPPYDLVSTVLYIAGDRMALNLGRTKAFDEIRLQSFTRMAERIGDDPDRVRRVVGETLERLRAAWPGVRVGEVVGADLRAAIDERLARLPLLTEA